MVISFHINMLFQLIFRVDLTLNPAKTDREFPFHRYQTVFTFYTSVIFNQLAYRAGVNIVSMSSRKS